MSEAQDLAVLSHAVIKRTVAGKELVINRIRVRQMARVMELVHPMAALLLKKTPNPQAGAKIKIDSIDIPKLVMTHGVSLALLVAEIEAYGNEGVTEDWVQDLELDDMIVLATAVVEVNLDFFIQRVFPALSTALASLNAEIHQKFLGGLTASKL